MEIVLIKPYQLASAGDKLDVPEAVAILLIRRGVARPAPKRKQPMESK